MPTDTTPDAQRAYYDALAHLTPAERVAVAMEMIATTDDLVRAGIRLRHPTATGDEFAYHFLRAKYGPELAGRVCRRQW